MRYHAVARGWIVAAVLAGGAVSAAWGAVSREVRFLTDRREVRPDETVSEGRWLLVSEDDVLARGAAPDFSDVRFINEGGEILPVATIPPRLVDERAELWIAAPLDWHEDGKTGWTATVNLGVDSLEQVALEPRGGAAPPGTTVDTSPDRERWLPLRPSPVVVPETPAPLPFPRGRGRFERAERWVRMTIPRGGPTPYLPDSLVVYRWWERDVSRADVPFQREGGGFRGRTWDGKYILRGPARAVAELHVTVPALDVSRPPFLPRVDIRLRGGEWIRVEASWAKGDQDVPHGDWILQFRPVRGTGVRITVPEADPPNQPFELEKIVVVPQRWAIRPPVPERVWLAYGDRQLSPRLWDLGDPTREGPPPILATLGPPESNPFYAAPKFGMEWLKRRPGVLAAFMVVLLVLVGLVVGRGFRGAAAHDD